MNGGTLAALFIAAAALVAAVVAWVFTRAMVETWSPELTIVTVMFAGVGFIILCVNVGIGARLALQDRHNHQRPIIVQAPQNPAGLLADPLRDADRLSRIEERFHRMGAGRENATVPAFQAGPYIEYDDSPTS